MNYKKKYKQDFLNELSANDNYDKIATKISFKPQKKNNIMKKGLLIGSSIACFTLILGVGGYLLLRGTSDTKVLSANGIVRMNLNPSITFMVDEENKVVSVTGENNEGKMIIVGEEIEGKTLEEAIEIVLKIENETGYLVSGNATINENNLSFSVTIDDEEIAKNIQDRISATVETVCEELNVNETVSYVKTTLEQYKQELLTYDSTLTEQELEKMSFDEVYESLKVNYQEASVMFSEELIELYNQSKAYEFKIAENEYTVELIKELGGIKASLLESVFTAYDFALEQFKNGINTLNQLRYESYVAEDSMYQKANTQLHTVKSEVISLKNKVASSENQESEETVALISKLDEKIKALEEATENLNSIKESVETSISEMEQALVTLMAKVTEVKNSIVSMLSIDLEAELTNKAVELDEYLNTTKNEFYTNFETKYAEDIELAKQKLVSYKEELIANNTTN